MREGSRPRSFFLIAMLMSSVLYAQYASAQAESAPPREPQIPRVPWNLTLSLEFDYRATTANVLIEPATKTYTNGIDVQRAYFAQPALADLRVESGSALPGVEGLGIAAELALKPEWRGDYFPSTNLPIAAGSYSLEANSFKRSVVYWKSPSLEVGFGRDQVDYNGILEGGFLPSSRIPWYDALTARGTLGCFSLDWMLSTIQAVKSWNNKDITPEAGYGFETDSTDPTIILEALTRLSWTLGAIEFGITDHAMLARRNNRFDFTDIFPFISRHQAGVAQTNNSMVLDASWRPSANLTIAAQAGFDDIDLNAIGVPDTGTPTIDAYVLGAHWSDESPIGHVSLYAEGGYTHWLWGNYDGSQASPNDINYFARFIYRFPRYGGGGILLPLTSPFGPGTLWARTQGSVRLVPIPALSLDLGYSFLFFDLNTEANLIDTPIYGNTTTAGAPRSINFVVSLPLALAYGPWSARIEPTLLWHDASVAFSADLGVGYTLSLERR